MRFNYDYISGITAHAVCESILRSRKVSEVNFCSHTLPLCRFYSASDREPKEPEAAFTPGQRVQG